MALGLRTEHVVPCSVTTRWRTCPANATWSSDLHRLSYPLPTYVEQQMRDAGWATVRDWNTGPRYWLCPEHAAQRRARLAFCTSQPS